MKFYRVEEAGTGRGPYSGASWRWRGEDEYQFTGPSHPCIEEDSPASEAFYKSYMMYGGYDNYRFCFSSVGQFCAWFHKYRWIQGLQDHGFVLSVYELLPECAALPGAFHLGDKQAVFRRGCATLVEKRPLMQEWIKVMGAQHAA